MVAPLIITEVCEKYEVEIFLPIAKRLRSSTGDSPFVCNVCTTKTSVIISLIARLAHRLTRIHELTNMLKNAVKGEKIPKDEICGERAT